MVLPPGPKASYSHRTRYETYLITFIVRVYCVRGIYADRKCCGLIRKWYQIMFCVSNARGSIRFICTNMHASIFLRTQSISAKIGQP
jgi:hypothetical protein